MKYILVSVLLCGVSSLGAFAQSGQSSEMQQSTSTTNTRQASPAKPVPKRSLRQQQRVGAAMDTTLPKKPTRTNRKQHRLPPDSLRRGGATRVDTV